jgi:hypothetical protein
LRPEIIASAAKADPIAACFGTIEVVRLQKSSAFICVHQRLVWPGNPQRRPQIVPLYCALDI